VNIAAGIAQLFADVVLENLFTKSNLTLSLRPPAVTQQDIDHMKQRRASRITASIYSVAICAKWRRSPGRPPATAASSKLLG
jgi:hypothetical protein